MDKPRKTLFGKNSDNDADPKSPQPWRRPHMEDLSTMKKKLESYTPPPLHSIPQVRILMIGQVGAGKSSFCNTISTIFSGVISHPCPCGSAEKSFTTVYRQYHVRSNDTNSNLKFCLCDTCGIEDGEGILLEDIKYLLEGRVPEEYEFNASLPINPNTLGFKKSPGLEDQVHCVAFVIDGSTAHYLDNAIWEKLKKINKEVCWRGIPRVILLTKVDKLCTDGDISKVFESSQVGDAVNKISAMLGIPRHNIHPIKNYEEEMELSNAISYLALTALEQMTTFASESLEQKCLSLSRIKPWRQASTDLNREAMQTLMEKMKTYAPRSGLGVPFARILLIGPVESGKSSFINTINSVYNGRMTQQVTDGSTTMYRQYQIEEHTTKTAMNFRLCDTCGIENIPSSDLTDLIYVMNGHVPDHYTFNSSSPITPSISGFKKYPRLKDKVHCVVFVFDASAINTIDKSMWEKLNDLQVRLSSIGLPRAVVLTKIDKLSQPLHDDLNTVFRSIEVEVAVKKVAQMLHVPENKIHPVKNYEEEIFINDKINTLSLLALDQILGFADDFLLCQNNTKKNTNYFIYVLISGLVFGIALAVIISKIFSI